MRSQSEEGIIFNQSEKRLENHVIFRIRIEHVIFEDYSSLIQIE